MTTPSPSSHLYNFEVQLHSVGRFFVPLPEGNVQCAFRLWDFPTLYIAVRSDGPSSQTDILVERGKTCLFEAVPSVLHSHLPLELRCVLFAEHGAAERTVLCSESLPLGDGENASTLNCILHRREVVLKDSYGTALCEAVFSLKLSCVGPYNAKVGGVQRGGVVEPQAGLHPEVSVAAFIRQETAGQLASLHALCAKYAEVGHLTVASCCTGGSNSNPTLAQNVFEHQISLLQQLEHNTHKIVALIEEEHTRRYGSRVVPLEVPPCPTLSQGKPRRRKRSNPPVRRCLTPGGEVGGGGGGGVSPEGVEAHGSLFVLVAGAVCAVVAKGGKGGKGKTVTVEKEVEKRVEAVRGGGGGGGGGDPPSTPEIPEFSPASIATSDGALQDTVPVLPAGAVGVVDPVRVVGRSAAQSALAAVEEEILEEGVPNYSDEDFE